MPIRAVKVAELLVDCVPAVARALLVCVVVWPLLRYRSNLDGETLDHNAKLQALAAADAVATADAQKPLAGDTAPFNTQLRKSFPDLTSAVAIDLGGVDEFGIARGNVLAVGDVTAEERKLLSEAAVSVAAASLEAIRTGKPADPNKLLVVLPDHRLAALIGLRDAANKAATQRLAGAIINRPIPKSHSGPMWPGMLAYFLFFGVWVNVVGAERHARRRWWRDVVEHVVFAVCVWLKTAEPESLIGNGVAVLGSDLFAPHLAFAAPESFWNAALGGTFAALIATAFFVKPMLRAIDAALRDPVPYFYVGPAALATGLLIFVPFAVGVGLSFAGRNNSFVGLDNYAEVLSSITDPNSSTHFGRTLAMTLLWTVVNVGLHVTIGLGLALVLNRPHLRGRTLYRLLLIVPWAVPSYITALTWKWLFNTQVGPLNAMLGALGIGKVDWLGTSAMTNFFANLATNVWLGFPFMMVISLGALQSIPAELYEAADMDGGTAWQKFRYVTLPLLRPALFPAIILGTIWTFNAFNVIWLVSGGGPDHQTDILITEAYYTFTVLRRTGLAAAYSVLIFGMLLGYTLATNRLTKATEAVNT